MNRLRTQMRWIMLIIVLAFLLSTFLMYDSGGSRGGSERREDYAVAEVNGKRLMRSELEQRVLLLLEQYGSASLASVDMPYIYKSALDQYAMELQMAQDVRDSGIVISDAEAEQAMKRYADSAFPTREAFYQYLERSGIKVSDYKADIARQMAGERLMMDAVGGTAVSEDEVKAFYDSMKDLFFRRPAGFMVSFASFASRDEAEKVRNLLVEGKPWNEATSADVVDPAKVLRVTSEPTFVSEAGFDGMFAPMKSDDIGAVSAVFELASDDFAVGVKTEKVEEKVSSYDEVSADIRALVRQQKEREALNAFSRKLLGKAKIVVLDSSLFPSGTPGAEVLPVTPDADAKSEDVKSKDVKTEDTKDEEIKSEKIESADAAD
ncbi:MAG: SurA N-terminal domain-containing protein [Synergistaceae bacterium]|nr:SurA N-terminal domain-containing protein [Synergistaceae bacterium]